MLYSVWYVFGGRRHYKGPRGNIPPADEIVHNNKTLELSDDEKKLSA